MTCFTLYVLRVSPITQKSIFSLISSGIQPNGFFFLEAFKISAARPIQSSGAEWNLVCAAHGTETKHLKKWSTSRNHVVLTLDNSGVHTTELQLPATQYSHGWIFLMCTFLKHLHTYSSPTQVFLCWPMRYLLSTMWICTNDWLTCCLPIYRFYKGGTPYTVIILISTQSLVMTHHSQHSLT